MGEYPVVIYDSFRTAEFLLLTLEYIWFDRFIVRYNDSLLVFKTFASLPEKGKCKTTVCLLRLRFSHYCFILFTSLGKISFLTEQFVNIFTLAFYCKSAFVWVWKFYSRTSPWSIRGISTMLKIICQKRLSGGR